MGVSLEQYLTLLPVERDNTRTPTPTGLQDPFEVQQREAYIPRVSNALYKEVTPVSYTDHFDELWRAAQAVIAPKQQRTRRYDQGRPTEEREDGWRLYLGLPQLYNTFSVSEYVPSRSTEKKKYFSIPSVTEQLRNEILLSAITREKGYDSAHFPDNRTLGEFIEKLKKDGSHRSYDSDGVMGNYQLSYGEDEVGPYIAYYDKHDLAYPGADKIGKPFEMYDRVYFDPETYKPLEASEIKERRAALSEIDAQKLRKLIPGLFGTK